MRALALLLLLSLAACGSTRLHVVEPPSRRLGGSFVVNDVEVAPSIAADWAKEDAARLTRELRGELAVVASDRAGDDRFTVDARIVGYAERMTVAVDVLDGAGKRLARFEVSAEGSKRGWTAAARDDARYECVQAIANFMRENR